MAVQGVVFLCMLISLVSADEFPQGSMAAQDPLPPCQTVILCNKQMCGDVCAPGTIELDPWVVGALQLQRSLQDNRSLSTVEWMGTHNALISRANGMGLSEDTAMALFGTMNPPVGVNNTTTRVSNQRHALLDLLNMGVRHVEIDIWWIWGPGAYLSVALLEFCEIRHLTETNSTPCRHPHLPQSDLRCVL
jgi:hypothetical protein